MPHKFDPSQMDLLLSAERRDSLDPFRVLSLTPVFQYHSIADIGCGPGYLTIPFAKHIYDGKIYAIDIQQEMLDALKKQVERNRLNNVELLLYDEGAKLPLEDDSVDGAIAAFSLHEANDPKALMEDTKRILLKSGWFAMLEWHKRQMDEGPPFEDRIAEEDLRAIAQEAGFRFESRYSLNDNQYMIIMRK